MIKFMLCCLLLVPAAAFAQAVVLRSGEHPNFSRLVLTIAEGTDWSVGRIDTGYRIELDEVPEGFDLRRVFTRIPRSRLQDAQADGMALDLTVACDCHVDAYLFQRTMLVVDIIDGPAPEDSPFEALVDDPALPDVEPPFWSIEVPAPISETEELIETPAVQLPLFTERAHETSVLTSLENSFQTEVPRDPNIVEAERAILESFARAATQGVFDFPARPLPPPPLEDDTQTPSPIAPITDPMDGVAIPLTGIDPGGPGFLLRTGIDRAALAGEDHDAVSTCPVEIDFDVESWGERDGFARLVPDLRRAVTDEAGNQRLPAIHDLARAYVYYGFGVEARQALRSISEPNPETNLLEILARLTDGDAVNVAELMPYRSCDPSMALWIALAGERVNRDHEDTIASILVAFRALPDTLRGHLGLRLARIFAEAGALSTAEDLLNGSLLAMTGDVRDAELAQADIAGRIEGPEAEVVQLEAFIVANPRAQPADMARLLDLSRETEAPVDDAILEIAEVMRFEANGSEPVSRLIEAEVRLLIDRDRPFDALALLEGDIGPMPDDRKSILQSETIVSLSEVADDDAFLTFAFSPLPDNTNDAALNALAGRLITMGFPSEALALIDETANDDDQSERERLWTVAAIALGDQERLDELLAMAPSTEAFQSTQDEEPIPGTALAGAWRDGEWEVLEQSDDPLLRAAGRALLTPVEPPGTETQLADTASLLEDARSARDLTSNLLERFSVDEVAAGN